MPSTEDIIGGLSAIIWSLTLLPLLKYVRRHLFIPYPDFTYSFAVKTFISLYFGTLEGEGGSFALYQGLFPAREVDYDEDRTLTGVSLDTEGRSPPVRRTFKERLRWPLLLLVSLSTMGRKTRA
jgi:KUP system potassium uptake protein